MRYKFEHEQNGSWPCRLVYDTDGGTLDDILSSFKDFLAGCGFQVQRGELVFEEHVERVQPTGDF